MFLREVVTGKREGKPVRYAQIVEAFRNEDGKSRHRILLSLGRVDRLDRDQVRRLVIALSRYLETGAVPEGGRVGDVRDFGVGYLADALWRRLGLPSFFAKQLRRRKYDAPVERALFALVAHRMVDPASKLACADWLAHDAFLPSAHDVSLQHLYRAMDFLDDCHEDLEAALYAHRRSLFDRVDLVYYDTTSTYFECDEPGDEPDEYGLRQRGYSRDLRPDRKQIVIGLAVDQQGLPVVSDVYSGDTGDALTVVPMLERLRALGLRRVVWVADRGMASSLNIAAVRKAGLDYILGVRLRAAEDLRGAIGADETPYEEAGDGMMVKDVRVADKRYVVCFSPASAERDLKLRTGAIDRMRPVLERVNGGADSDAITTHGLYRRFVTKRSDGTFQLDKRKLEREAECDGTFVLDVSKKTMSAKDAATAYKGLLRVEHAFHGLPAWSSPSVSVGLPILATRSTHWVSRRLWREYNGVNVRPVFHRLDKRIRAHVTLCMLAYFIERVVENETKMTFAQVRKVMRRVRAVQITFDKQTVWETSGLAVDAKPVLAALKIPPPPRVLPNEIP